VLEGYEGVTRNTDVSQDIGIDSLSSLVISSRLREELALDLDPNFALFVDCPTVAVLKTLLNDFSSSDTGERTKELNPAPTAPTEAATESTEVARSPPSQAAGGKSEIMQEALKIIAEESGIAVEDFSDDTAFADIGIDSLCSMVIGSRLREEMDLDLDSSFSLFLDLPTVSHLAAFLSSGTTNTNSGRDTGSDSPGSDESSGVMAESSADSSVTGYSSASEVLEVEEQKPALQLVEECKSTSSVIIQGLPKLARRVLFMLPDGGGSASSYATIPRLATDTAIIGLNCPYARDPENMNCTHTAMIRSFIAEIKRRQPRGPYHLGGWSSGGAFAYVTAEALVNQGEEVSSLIIIDAPVPQVMEKLPVEFYQHCNAVGLFENQPGGAAFTEPPPYLIPHFMAVVDVMLDYKVAPLNTLKMPKVGLVWASETVMEEGEAPKMKGMHFMVQKRQRFDADGWDTVLPGADFDIVKADGANHFTLMVSYFLYSVPTDCPSLPCIVLTSMLLLDQEPCPHSTRPDRQGIDLREVWCS
jgi:acyl carrier protein/pimeloyl-ACP methyl ester carboxylesterase